MASIQQIPFYLPLNVNFDTTQIVPNSFHEDYNWAYNVGSTLSFYDPISKFVVTTQFGDVIKEHIFISINEGGYRNSIMYPIAIKSYKLDDKYNRYYPKTVLLKSGISNVLSQIGTILNTKYYFLSRLYLDKALEMYNPDKVDQLVTSYAYRSSLENTYKSLEYINNECSPSITFNFTQFLDDLTYRNIHYTTMTDIFKTNETIDSIIEMFTPKLDYPLFGDALTTLSLCSDIVSPKDILSSMYLYNIKENNLAMTNTFVEKILEKADRIIYAFSSVVHDEMLSFSIYMFYELFQDCPFKEGYIKYILLPSGQLEIDLNSLIFVNWYYNLRYDGNLHTKQQLSWIRILTQEVQCLLEAMNIKFCICSVEITFQDYHAIITVNNDGTKISIVFDMIVSMLMSKTLFFTEDQYTNDQYCYYPSVTL